ncbi:hypothetical protein SEA_PABST_50 [Microbacterium phage Pabst]|nr:hypothetical protein SEA_PABST_50 [Microbacterium phage Pabst]
MALMPEDGTARESVYERFGIAQDAPVPEDMKDRQDVQISVRSQIYTAAKFLNSKVEDSREKSLALTHLEEALMWAGKAIFKNP